MAVIAQSRWFKINAQPKGQNLHHVAAKPWKRLIRLDALKCSMADLAARGAWADITLGVDRALMAAASKHKRGPVDYFYRRIRRRLCSTSPARSTSSSWVTSTGTASSTSMVLLDWLQTNSMRSSRRAGKRWEVDCQKPQQTVQDSRGNRTMAGSNIR